MGLAAGAPSTTQVANRFTAFIRPGHPLLGRLFTPPRGGAYLAAALEDLAARTRYVPGPPGHRPFEQFEHDAEAAAGPLPLNCLNRCAVLVSQLRARGASESEVFVAIGTRRRDRLSPRVHAWVAIRARGMLLWIDPIDIAPQRLSVEEIRTRFVLSIVFNDRHAYVTAAEQEQALASGPAHGPRTCVYGHADLRVLGIATRPAFAQLLQPLFRDGEGNSTDVDPELLREAEALDLVSVQGSRYHGSRRLTVVPATAEEDLRGMLAPQLDEYIDAFAQWIPRLHDAYAASRTARDFDWPQVAHTIMAGMVADVGVGRRLALHDIAQERHGATVVWAFEQISARNPFGVVWISGHEATSGIGQLWHHSVWRKPMMLGVKAVSALERLAGGEDCDAREHLYLKHLDLVESSGTRVRVKIPIFHPEDVARLSPLIRQTSEALVTRAVNPAIARVHDSPWWKAQGNDTATRLAAVRLFLEYCTDRLVSDHLMPPFPAGPAVPLAWGRWIWLEPSGAAASICPPTFSAAREARI